MSFLRKHGQKRRPLTKPSTPLSLVQVSPEVITKPTSLKKDFLTDKIKTIRAIVMAGTEVPREGF